VKLAAPDGSIKANFIPSVFFNRATRAMSFDLRHF
jgi:hypothetical protein